MLGIIQYERRKGQRPVERTMIGPLEVATVTLFVPEGLPEWRVRHRIKRLTRELRQLGVRRIIVPSDLPWSEGLSGFQQVDPIPFYRGISDVLSVGCLMCKGKQPAREKIVLSAARLCPELTAAAERLCPQVRGLSIQVPWEGAEYANWLHRQYGMPVSTPEGAAVTAAFHPGGESWGVELRLYEGGGLPKEFRLWAEGLDLPTKYAPELMTAMWEQGTLPREAVRVTEWAQDVMQC